MDGLSQLEGAAVEEAEEEEAGTMQANISLATPLCDLLIEPS